MNKKDFLNQLKSELANHNVVEIEDIISYHDEMIDAKIDLGLSEDEVLKDYQSIDSIIRELASDHDIDRKFTYQDFIKQTPKRYLREENPISPKTINGISHFEIPVNEKSSINVDIGGYTTHLSTSSRVGSIAISATKSMFTKIQAYESDGNILIRQRSKNWGISLALYLILIAGLFLLIQIPFNNWFDPADWWQYIISLSIAFTIVHLGYLFYFLAYRRDRKIEIVFPSSLDLNALNVIIKSGRCYASDLIANHMNLKVLSGRITANNLYAHNLDIKVSSGTITFNDEFTPSEQFCQNLNLQIFSGKALINHLNAKQAKLRVSSGHIQFNHCKLNDSKVRVSSGSLRANYVKFGDFHFEVSSGSIKGSDIHLGSGYLKVSSGRITLDQITGSHTDYMFGIKTSSGSFRLNGEKQNFIGYKLVKELPQKSINGKVSSGRLSLSFKADQQVL